MPLEIKLTPKLAYKLRLTPQMRLALNLLQLPLLQLKEYLKQEIEKNPLLEPSEDSPILSKEKLDEAIRRAESQEDKQYEFDMPWTEGDEEKRRYQESLISESTTLQEHLLKQLRLLTNSKKDFEIGEFIIGNIDENGYLRNTIEEVAKTLKVDATKVTEILYLIQTLDPIGIGARNLKECLLLQLKARGKENSLAGQIVDKYLPYLEKKRFEFIARKLKTPVQKVKEAIKEVADLEPKPGRSFSAEKTTRLIPDAVLRKNKEDHEIIFNDSELPRLNLNAKYINMLKQKDVPEDTKEYLRERLKAARALINAVNKRKETLKKIVEEIVHTQKEFFDKGATSFKPMTLTQIAKAVDKHKSTVSRAIVNKFLQTQEGIFELRYFLNSGVKQENGEFFSSKMIKSKMKGLIENENRENPFSDQKITEHLKGEGIFISRRTVTKYRDKLKFLPSKSRRE